MKSIPTIPCPVCNAPVHVRPVELPTGDITQVYAEPMIWDEQLLAFHRHQAADVFMRQLH